MALSKSLGAFPAFKIQSITFIGNEYKWQLFLTYSDLREKGKIVPFQTMNTSRGSRSIKQFIHYFGTRWQWVVNLTP